MTYHPTMHLCGFLEKQPHAGLALRIIIRRQRGKCSSNNHFTSPGLALGVLTMICLYPSREHEQWLWKETHLQATQPFKTAATEMAEL